MNCLPSWSTEESSNWVMFPSFLLFSLQSQSHDNPVDREGETFVSRANLTRGNRPHTTWTVTMETLTQFTSSLIMFILHSVIYGSFLFLKSRILSWVEHQHELNRSFNGVKYNRRQWKVGSNWNQTLGPWLELPMLWPCEHMNWEKLWALVVSCLVLIAQWQNSGCTSQVSWGWFQHFHLPLRYDMHIQSWQNFLCSDNPNKYGLLFKLTSLSSNNLSNWTPWYRGTRSCMWCAWVGYVCVYVVCVCVRIARRSLMYYHTIWYTWRSQGTYT